MRMHQKPSKAGARLIERRDLMNFITTLYDGDLHAKRVLSLANATLGVLASASLAIHAVGRGLAQAMGTLTKHGVKQVDRLLSNQGVDVWTFFACWTPYIVGAREEVVVALDWTSFASDGQDTIVLSMLTGHGRATPLLWKTVETSTLKGNQRRYEYEVAVPVAGGTAGWGEGYGRRGSGLWGLQAVLPADGGAGLRIRDSIARRHLRNECTGRPSGWRRTGSALGAVRADWWVPG